jgi:hypothetical protein
MDYFLLSPPPSKVSDCYLMPTQQFFSYIMASFDIVILSNNSV